MYSQRLGDEFLKNMYLAFVRTLTDDILNFDSDLFLNIADYFKPGDDMQTSLRRVALFLEQCPWNENTYQEWIASGCPRRLHPIAFDKLADLEPQEKTGVVEANALVLHSCNMILDAGYSSIYNQVNAEASSFFEAMYTDFMHPPDLVVEVSDSD